MEKIHILAFNLNLYDENSIWLSKRKKNIVRAVFKNYRKYIDGDAIQGDVTMFSFRPVDCKHGYNTFVKHFLHFNTTEPCIIIFQSLFDLADRGNLAYSRLYSLINNSNVRAVYFSDYSLQHTASLYLDNIKAVFSDERTNNEKQSHKTKTYPEKFTQYVITLRDKLPPVQLSSIASYTGVSENTLRSLIGKHASKSMRGRSLNDDEKKKLKTYLIGKKSPIHILDENDTF